jgi:serine/threonine protein kinase
MKDSNHPFIVKLRYSFQNAKNIYFVMEYLEGGRLFRSLSIKMNKFTEKVAKFYIAEIVLGLQYLQNELRAIYRLFFWDKFTNLIFLNY